MGLNREKTSGQKLGINDPIHWEVLHTRVDQKRSNLICNGFHPKKWTKTEFHLWQNTTSTTNIHNSTSVERIPRLGRFILVQTIYHFQSNGIHRMQNPEIALSKDCPQLCNFIALILEKVTKMYLPLLSHHLSEMAVKLETSELSILTGISENAQTIFERQYFLHWRGKLNKMTYWLRILEQIFCSIPDQRFNSGLWGETIELVKTNSTSKLLMSNSLLTEIFKI